MTSCLDNFQKQDSLINTKQLTGSRDGREQNDL